MTEQAEVTDAMIENAVRHHSDKIKNPRAVQALVDEYLLTPSPGGDVKHISQDRRTEFLIQLAKLERETRRGHRSRDMASLVGALGLSPGPPGSEPPKERPIDLGLRPMAERCAKSHLS